jgi:hypothetical protein
MASSSPSMARTFSLWSRSWTALAILSWARGIVSSVCLWDCPSKLCSGRWSVLEKSALSRACSSPSRTGEFLVIPPFCRPCIASWNVLRKSALVGRHTAPGEGSHRLPQTPCPRRLRSGSPTGYSLASFLASSALLWKSLMLLQSLEFIPFIEITDIDWAAGEPKAAAEARGLPSTPSKSDGSVRGRGKMVFDPLAQMSVDAEMLPTPPKTGMFYRSLRPGPLLETNCARLASLKPPRLPSPPLICSQSTTCWR